MDEKFTMKKKWCILDKNGVKIGVAGLSYTPVFYDGKQFFMLAWVDVVAKHTIAELFDFDGNGLSPNHYRLENEKDAEARN